MARPLRVEFPGALDHLMSSGDGSFATTSTGRSGSSGSGEPSRPTARRS
ncbi:MAG: hypothetical protein HQ567_21055 [Candidatus Nealsonbacteria bacterium]|nr:hypothetical protein [Candidatus Nealsonbacteria bacterium]